MAVIASAIGFNRAMFVASVHLLETHFLGPFPETLPAEHDVVSAHEGLFPPAQKALVCAAAEFLHLVSAHYCTSTW
jgi:hypothetical protein